jgi:hypothetical protein
VSAEIRITRVTKHAGALLSKRIFCGEDGRPQSDGSRAPWRTGPRCASV